MHTQIFMRRRERQQGVEVVSAKKERKVGLVVGLLEEELSSWVSGRMTIFLTRSKLKMKPNDDVVVVVACVKESETSD
jgi:hypothetical protein